MKVKLGSIAKVVYPLFLGWFFFFCWRGLLSDQIVQPVIWPFLIIGGIMLSICFSLLFFSGLFAVDSHKDKIKYLSLLAVSFGASSIALMESTDNSIYESKFAKLENSIQYFNEKNENKSYLTSKPYAEFLKAKSTLDVTKLKEYTKSIDSLVSIDKNLSMNLILVRELVTSFDVNNQFNTISADHFVSKTEYNEFRDFVLTNSKGNERLSLVMSN